LCIFRIYVRNNNDLRISEYSPSFSLSSLFPVLCYTQMFFSVAILTAIESPTLWCNFIILHTINRVVMFIRLVFNLIIF
jgi:hypothetical protein